MKYCTYCGKPLSHDARFCEGCGSGVREEVAPEDEVKKCRATFYRLLNYERLAWKIQGIILLVLGCFFLAMGMLFLVVACGAYGNALAASLFLMGYMLVFAMIFLPVAIVNLVMAKKASGYMYKVYCDPAAAMARCGSVGTIILAAFFNEFALIFVIINFVRTKTNRKVIDRFTSER